MAIADVRIQTVLALAAVLAGCRLALVDVILAPEPCEAADAGTLIVVLAVNADPVIEAWIADAFVDFALTVDAGESWGVG